MFTNEILVNRTPLINIKAQIDNENERKITA